MNAGDTRPDDAALVDRAKQGDADAYAELVMRHQQLAYRTAYVITRSRPDAEEAAQDAFVKAYYALARFREGAPFRPWLLRIVANEALNRRKAAARRQTSDLGEVEHRIATDPAASPETAALGAEQRASLLAAMERLSDADRLVVAYRYFFDLSEAEMAEALGCARGTVKSRLSRALVRLRGVLDA